MAKRARFTVILTALVVFGAIFTPSAFANSVGQCGGEVHTGGQLYESWQNEGVAPQAVSLVVKKAGYHQMDGKPKPWMENHVVQPTLAQTVTLPDYGCHPGEIFGAGTRTFAKGENPVLAVLPPWLSKKEVRLTPHKGYKRIAVRMHVVGKVECSNPMGSTALFYVYVKIKPHHHRKHHHHKCGCHKTPKKKPPSNGPICSQNSGNGTSCGGGPCSTTTIIVGSGNTVNSSTACKTEEPKKPCGCTPAPPEETCGCTPEEPKAAPEIAIEAINDFETNEENVICARTTAPSGDNLSVTFFAENGGEFSNHGVATLRSGTTNEWCSPYTAPSEVPPGGCDIIKAVVQDNTTGLSGKDVKKAPIKLETF